MKEWEIGVISVDRSRNCAYVYVQQNKPFYWATNNEVNLKWVEDKCGCVFKDGMLPTFVIFHLYEWLGDKMEIEYL